MSVALFHFTTVSCVLEMKCFHDLSCVAPNILFCRVKIHVSSLGTPFRGSIIQGGASVYFRFATLLFFRQKGGEFIYKLVSKKKFAYHIILAKTSFYTNFIRLNTKTSDSLINKVYIFCHPQKGGDC